MSETQMPRCMFETILERFGIVPTLVYVYLTAVEHRHGRRYEGGTGRASASAFALRRIANPPLPRTTQPAVPARCCWRSPPRRANTSRSKARRRTWPSSGVGVAKRRSAVESVP